MKNSFLLLIVLITIVISAKLYSEPGFNGSAPGCSGSGCHSFLDNSVNVVQLTNLQVQVTLTGNTGNVAGELVNSNGTVVAVINSTSSNPFILTAPAEGTYLVNAGYKNPSRRWDSTHVTLQLSLPPAPPSNLVSQLIPNPLSVQLSWTDNSNNENGFIIERESQGPDAFTVIDTVYANTTIFVDNTVTYTSYNYRICSFNFFGQSAYSNISQIVVPVELISFTSSVKDAIVSLEWATATEVNNKGFEVQRSQEGEFETLGFVEGHGTTTESQIYSYIDKNLVAGKYNYRLKQIDFDGTFEYSNVIEAEVTSPTAFSLEQNYPNPFNPSTKINYSIPQSSDVVLIIYNVLGKEITTLTNEKQAAGIYEVEFNASDLPSGIYLYQLRTGSYVETKKMILIK